METKISYKLSLTLIMFLFVQVVNGQITVNSFKVLDQYLKDGKILIKSGVTTTEIKIEVRFVTAMNGANPKPGSIKTRLSTPASNGSPNYLSPQQQVTHTEFAQDNAFLTKIYTLSIDKSKLANGNIYLLFQNDSGEFAYSGKSYGFVLETSVPVVPEISNNFISFSSGDVNFFDDFTVAGSVPAGGNNSYTYQWEVVDEDDSSAGFWVAGVNSTENLWEKDNTNFAPINGSYINKNVYLRRKVTSGAKVSYSNRILLYNSSTANKNDLAVKVKGRLLKHLINGQWEDTNTEIDVASLDVQGGFALKFDANMLPETTFRIENNVAGVRYKWAYISGGLRGMQEGNSILTPIYPGGNWGFNAYKLRVFGSDGSYKEIGFYPLP